MHQTSSRNDEVEAVLWQTWFNKKNTEEGGGTKEGRRRTRAPLSKREPNHRWGTTPGDSSVLFGLLPFLFYFLKFFTPRVGDHSRGLFGAVWTFALKIVFFEMFHPLGGGPLPGTPRCCLDFCLFYFIF